jgi:D-alanyl-D-alanine carboxypeptidase (penicillin-binding protein 5/6)
MKSLNLAHFLKKSFFNFLPKRVKNTLLDFYRKKRYLSALHTALSNKSEFERIASDCKSGILMDVAEQKILWEKDRQVVFPIGSLSKIMTMLIILDQMKVDPRIKMDSELVADEGFDNIGQTIGLEIHQAYTVEKLLAGSIIYSANDCIDLLVRNFFDGRPETFVSKMNERTKELGLLNTKFYNPHGLEPFPGTYWKSDNVSSAQDIARLTNLLISTHPYILKYSSALVLDFNINKSHFTSVKNTNYPLLSNNDKCDGFKTGFTTTAQYCLCGTSKIGDVRYIAVAIGMSNEMDRNIFVNSLLRLGQLNKI